METCHTSTKSHAAASPYLRVAIIAQCEKVEAGTRGYQQPVLCMQATHLLLGAAFGEGGACVLCNLCICNGEGT